MCTQKTFKGQCLLLKCQKPSSAAILTLMVVPEETVRVMSASIAPVFLISGVGVLLSSMAIRYARVIDRVRYLLDLIQNNPELESSKQFQMEIRELYKRARQLRTTIILAAMSIFCVVLTIILIFAMLMFKFVVPLTAEILFIASLLFLLLSVAIFIEDFAISLRIIKMEINSRIKKQLE